MMTRKIKTIINKKKKERENSTCSNDESLLYDELYEGLFTYENTIAVHPESSSAGQETIPLSQMDSLKLEKQFIKDKRCF